MTMTHEQSMQFLQQFLYEQLPLTKAMQVQVAAYDGQSLVLTAPLACNHNDKGTAFAGSIGSLATVCGWGLWMLWTKAHYDECQVAVSHGDIQYKKPITTDFWAKAMLPDDDILAHIQKTLSHKGKVRAQTYIAVGDDHNTAASQLAEYALWRKTT
jgi:thioesterase domain-containing protein